MDLVESLTSEAIPSATQFFKRAYKTSHPPRLAILLDYKHHGLLLLAFNLVKNGA
jgi:hypothetical protein